jgi:hypothetical protein
MRTRRAVPYLAAGAAALALVPATAEARVAPPTGNWQGNIAVYRNGVLRGRVPLLLAIPSLRVGRVSARADWRGRPRCTDFLRLEHARAGRWHFSIAASVGACAGSSWKFDLTRSRPGQLELRAVSPALRYRAIVYRGTLRRI